MNSENIILEFSNRTPLNIIYQIDSDPFQVLKKIDALLIETNYGFNSFGMYCAFIAKELNTNPDTIRNIGDSLLKEKIPTINIVISKNIKPTLKAIALISNPNCDSYIPFEGNGERPSKDFFYNIVYEALANLVDLGFTNVGIAGLTGSLRFINDNQYKNSVAEAICHCAHDFPELKIIQILMYGPHITYGVDYFNKNKDESKLHKKISTTVLNLDGIRKIRLNIPINSYKN
jgi:hypothetical protein